MVTVTKNCVSYIVEESAVAKYEAEGYTVEEPKKVEVPKAEPKKATKKAPKKTSKK